MLRNSLTPLTEAQANRDMAKFLANRNEIRRLEKENNKMRVPLLMFKERQFLEHFGVELGDDIVIEEKDWSKGIFNTPMKETVVQLEDISVYDFNSLDFDGDYTHIRFRRYTKAGKPFAHSEQASGTVVLRKHTK